MTEAELKSAVLDIADAAGWRVFSMAQARQVRPAKRSASGFPDAVLARYGRVLFLEFKAQDGILSECQMKWMRELGDAMVVVRPNDLTDDGWLRRLLA